MLTNLYSALSKMIRWPMKTQNAVKCELFGFDGLSLQLIDCEWRIYEPVG